MTTPLASSMENIMSKSLAIVGAALLAVSASSLSVPTTAEAGKHFGGGGHHHHHRFHHHHRRSIIVTPVYTETRRAPVVTEKKIIVSYADGMGRLYDVASKTWYDGKGQCWTGKSPWTFKSGSWFYGSYRWAPSGDTWRTNGPEAPVAVDCSTVPAFAAKPAAIGGYADQGDPVEPKVATVPATPPITAVEKANGNTAKTGNCKQYFPSVGEMLPVPCKN